MKFSPKDSTWRVKFLVDGAEDDILTDVKDIEIIENSVFFYTDPVGPEVDKSIRASYPLNVIFWYKPVTA